MQISMKESSTDKYFWDAAAVLTSMMIFASSIPAEDLVSLHLILLLAVGSFLENSLDAILAIVRLLSSSLLVS